MITRIRHRKGRLMVQSLMATTALGLMIAGSMADGDTITEDFEGLTAGGTTTPSVWTHQSTGLAGGSGTVSYATSAAGAGSQNTGLAGVLTDATVGTHTGRVPHTIFVNSGSASGFDLGQNITGSYDFKHTGGSAYASSAFLFGDIKTPADIDGSSAGQLLQFFHSRGGYGNAPSGFVDGTEATIQSKSNFNYSDNTWYRVSFTWTATGAKTGDLAITSTRWNGSSYVAHNSDTYSGFTFDSNEAFFGFGNVYNNDTSGVSIDNISITGTLIPEPSTLALIGLGACMMIRRRRRN